MIGKVHTHPRTGQLVLHWLPTGRWESLTAVPVSKLSPGDAASAKRLLTATTMQALQVGDPLGSLGGVALAGQHTPLIFWSGQGTRWDLTAPTGLLVDPDCSKVQTKKLYPKSACAW